MVVNFAFYTPTFLDGESFSAIPSVLMGNVAVILPVAFVGAVNTLVSVYAAHSAGDFYPIRECLVVDGLTTIVAGLFGSPFGTCVYCGQPQFKAQGGVIYYSFMNCFIFCFLASTGLFAAINAFIPPWGIAPIILFVGLAIAQDAFDIIKPRHLPAAILGLMPAVADWVLSKWPHDPPPPVGLAAIAHGSLLVCICWVAMGVFIIDRNFFKALIWAAVSMGISALGLMHQESADLTFKTFTGAKGQVFGTSAGGYTMGYATLVGLFGALIGLRRMGVSRIPPQIVEKEETPEQEAEEMAGLAGSRFWVQDGRPKLFVFSCCGRCSFTVFYNKELRSCAQSPTETKGARDDGHLFFPEIVFELLGMRQLVWANLERLSF
ncbi:unnamed protein product [Symbiodinium natans]|uniref:Uncharacterized protein n=1 Tax=Symbiodinium natans TaxID=878477 RepID=A0A812JWC3_9DINO|nr:unnamed protein product [Symbiodinium natans]